ncbi:hypothetical protein [Amycolatopsis sp. NPDC003731]
MTVDFESLATLLPITFTSLFAITFAIGLAQQWAASRRRAHASGGRGTHPRRRRLDESGRELR